MESVCTNALYLGQDSVDWCKSRYTAGIKGEVNKTSLVEWRSASLVSLLWASAWPAFLYFEQLWILYVFGQDRSAGPALHYRWRYFMFIIYPNQSMLAPVQLGIRLFLFSEKFNSCGNCSFGTLSWINSRQVAGESVTTALPFTANRSSLRCSFSEIRSFFVNCTSLLWALGAIFEFCTLLGKTSPTFQKRRAIT